MADLDPDFIEAGIEAADLIADPRSWINRRVETIELLSKEETRRRVSVDFTLSDEQRGELSTRHGVVVPISVLSKHPRRNFDLRDESGAALPALGRSDNGELALIALLSATLDALPEDPSDDLLELLTADLRQIIYSNEDDAAVALSFFVGGAQAGDPARAAMWEDPTCRSLLTTLATDYVLFAALPKEGPSRRVLKYSYGDDLPLDLPWLRKLDKYAPTELWWRAWQPDRSRFLIDCPGAWRACSFHMEIAIPEELRVRGAVLVRFPQDDPNEEAEALGAPDEWANRAALYAPEDIHQEDDVRAVVEIVAERVGGAMRAALTASTVAGLLWLGWASRLDFGSPDAAVSTLLVGAAVLSFFAAATGQHLIVNKIFRTRRRALLLVTATAVAGATCLAMDLPNQLTTWLVSAIACTLAALRLMWSAVRAAK